MNTATSSDLEIDSMPEDEAIALPASFAQQRLWFAAQLDPGSAVYNVPFAVRLRGRLDADALADSLNTIVQRHEVLRTTFASVDGEPVQVIAPELAIALATINLTSMADDERDPDALARDEAGRPFDLARDPLLRATLLRLADDDHLLLLTTHHIVSDGWSMEILFQELTTLYAARLTGQRAALSELPIQYADYAIWQRETLQGETLQDQLVYWQESLAGAPTVLDLPTDRPRPSMQSFRGAVHAFDLPRSIVGGVERLAVSEQATPFMVHLAALTSLLQRHTGRDDIVIGTPVANRERTEIEDLIGFFVNTLAIRTDLSGDPTFRAVLRRVREQTLDAYAHQELPFEKLVEALRPERALSHTPIFQVMLSYHQPSAAPTLPGLSVQVVETHNGTAPFELTLTLTETVSGASATLEYNADLFEPSTIARLAGQYQALLEAVLADPDRALSSLSLLTASDRAQLAGWNDTAAEYPADACIHSLIEAQAARTPDATAAISDNCALSYRRLDARANQLARRLSSEGAGPDVMVGICMERSLDMLVAVLGVLKAGAAYLPLDPTYPAERLGYMLDDSGASIVLTDGDRAGVVDCAGRRVRVIDVVAEHDTIAQLPTDAVDALVLPDHVAYVIYTSGSTGRPKGVQVTHRAAVNLFCSIRSEPGLTRQDMMLAVTTLSFDIATLELLLPLVVGARVVIAPRDAVADGPRLIRLLTQSRATVMQATPATWRLLLDSGWSNAHGLRIFSGGETMTSELASGLIRIGARVCNMYGPTETTIYSTVHRVTDALHPIPIGYPIANTRVYILDEHLRALPPGMPGELYIAGDGLARGYLNRADLTAERFIPDPFASSPGGRLYRTGDLARRRADGVVEHLGRLDHQVKLRGYRIELGEIESALVQHPAVRQAVVTVRDDVAGDQRLVAFVAADRASLPAASDLRYLLQESLPGYMVPATFVRLDRFPLTPSGKVDRRALPAPDAAPEPTASRVPPRTETERALATIWSELLGVEGIGVDASFFDLGGHSLLVTRLMSRVREGFSVEVRLRDFFAGPTISALAEAVDTATLLSASAADLEAALALLEEDN